MRVWIAFQCFNTEEDRGSQRARRLWIAVCAPSDAEMANNTPCSLRLRPSSRASVPSWKLSLPPGQNRSPTTRRRPILVPPYGENAFAGGRTSCALRLRPSSRASATSWKLSLPPSQKRSPAIRRRPIFVPPSGQNAFPGGRTLYNVRVQTGGQGPRTQQPKRSRCEQRRTHADRVPGARQGR